VQSNEASTGQARAASGIVGELMPCRGKKPFMLTMRTGFQLLDVEDLVALLHDAEEDDERIRAALNHRAFHTYTGWLDGQLVGAAVVQWRPGRHSEIVYIAVEEDKRGSGYGRQILEHVKAELPRHGRRLLVGTASSSIDNIAFYQRCGFRITAVKRDHFAYIDPEVTEFNIPVRDMIVFSYEQVEGLPDQDAALDIVNLTALDEESFLLIPASTRATSRNNAVLRAARSLRARLGGRSR
jgi:ribosomal protein S18 acetylase RimI-like enzyme